MVFTTRPNFHWWIKRWIVACETFAPEVPFETFFQKIGMIRNNLRVLEQKVNASDKLSEANKFDLQQYITRCYGSLTTVNILFKNKDDQFRSSAVDQFERLSQICNPQSAIPDPVDPGSVTTARTLAQRACYART